jgi:hypothetical protein
MAAAFGLAALTGVASACDFFHDNGNSSSTAPTAIVEKFSGSLLQQKSVVFSFNTSQAGLVDVTLTTMTPTSSSTVGLGIGTANGADCTLTNSASAVAAGSTAQLSVNEKAGPYCVKVSDNTLTPLSQTVTVTVTVSHQ